MPGEDSTYKGLGFACGRSWWFPAVSEHTISHQTRPLTSPAWHGWPLCLSEVPWSGIGLRHELWFSRVWTPVFPKSPPRWHRPPLPVHQGTWPCWPYGWRGHLTMLSVKGFFSVASLSSLLPFVPVCLSSVSDPCPYPSCLCLPLRTSFSRCPSSSRREGAAASSVPSLCTFMNIPVWPTIITLQSIISKILSIQMLFVNEKSGFSQFFCMANPYWFRFVLLISRCQSGYEPFCIRIIC